MMPQNKNIWIFAQTDQTVFPPADAALPAEYQQSATEFLALNRLNSSAYELLTAARELAAVSGGQICAVLIGAHVRRFAEDLFAHGADKIYLCENEALEHFCDERYARILADLIALYGPDKFLVPATYQGRALAARTAVLARTGLTADATALHLNPSDGQLVVTRPTFGGNLMADITCTARPEMCTVRTGAYAPSAAQTGRTGEIVTFPFDAQKYTARTKFLDFIAAETDGPDLRTADVVVAGGRGLGKKEGFELLARLAARLGGALGATRPAADSGWIDPACQIGVTGQLIKPKLYIACGISGQIHHTAGLAGTGTLIAINKDPDAPIMKMADYAVTGDLYEIIPALLEQLN